MIRSLIMTTYKYVSSLDLLSGSLSQPSYINTANMCLDQELSGVCDVCSFQHDSTFEQPTARQVQCNRIPPRQHYIATVITCPYCKTQTIMRQSYDPMVAVEYRITTGTGDSAVRRWATSADLIDEDPRTIAHYGQAHHVRRLAMGWPFNAMEHPRPRRPATDFATILGERTPELEAAVPVQRTPEIPEYRQAEIDSRPLGTTSGARVLAAARRTQAKAAEAVQSIKKVVRSASNSSRSTPHEGRPSTSGSTTATTNPGPARFLPNSFPNSQAEANGLQRRPAIKRTDSEAARIRRPSQAESTPDQPTQTTEAPNVEEAASHASAHTNQPSCAATAIRPQTASAEANTGAPAATTQGPRTVRFVEPQRSRTVSTRPATANQTANSRAFTQNFTAPTAADSDEWSFIRNHNARANSSNNNVAAQGSSVVHSPQPQRSIKAPLESWNQRTQQHSRQEEPTRPPRPIRRLKKKANFGKTSRTSQESKTDPDEDLL